MKYIAIVLVAFSLSGCYQSVNQWDLQDAATICGGVEKIAHINSLFSGDERVTCTNSQSRALHKGE